MDEFKTIIDKFESTVEEKKSVFIGALTPVKTEEEALAFIDEVRKKQKGARHNVYAYVIGPNEEILRYSDDKEPKGTAGIPVLDVLKKSGLKNVCLVVTRYFGGVLLGASNLTRVYALCASDTVNAAEKVTIIRAAEFSVELSYDIYSKLTVFLQEADINIYDTEFTDRVVLSIRSCKSEELLRNEFRDRTGNKAIISEFNYSLYFRKDNGELIPYSY